MNPSATFIARPVATTLLTVAVALAGAIAFTVLPVSPLPQVDFPTITVGGVAAGCERGYHGVLHRDAVRTGIRAHRRRDGDDLHQQSGHDGELRCSSI